MKVKRRIMRIDEDKCDGCGLCIPSCPEGALQIVEGKARLVRESYCDGLGTCIGHCPRGAITIEEREAEPFEEEAVREHLPGPRESETPEEAPCISCAVGTQTWRGEEAPGPQVPLRSELTHWPFQIGLVSPGPRSSKAQTF